MLGIMGVQNKQDGSNGCYSMKTVVGSPIWFKSGNGTGDGMTTSVVCSTGDIYIVSGSHNNFKVNDETATGSRAWTAILTSNYTITLFACKTNTPLNNTYTSGRIYYFRLYEGDTLVRNMIPCYRISDSVIGMYDLVNNVFYSGNLNTFSIGAVIDNRKSATTSKYTQTWISSLL